MKKKFLFFSFAIVLFITIIFTKDSHAATSLTQLQSDYPTGSKWEDTYTGKKKVEGGYARVLASECAGFAALMYNRYYDMDPYEYAEQIYDISQVQPGDIVRYGNNAHSVWVLSREGDSVTVAECNYDLQCTVRWYERKTIAELGYGLTYIYKAPYSLTTAMSRSNGSRTSVYNNDTQSVVYRTHVQNVGWQSYVHNGDISGTMGLSYRLEALNIKLENAIFDGNIEYSTHVENIGWQGFVKNGGLSGTSGQSLRLEAIKIKLTGEMANHYDIYYRVHAQNFGWMGWAKNGEEAGTAGYGYRLEALQIVLVKKGDSAPGSTENSYRENKLSYQTHVESDGWQNLVGTGDISGTSGRGLRLEGIKIALANQEFSGSIAYSTHVENIGWQNSVNNGEMSGTSGMALRLEAIKINLTGDMAKHYDVYYRVHAQNFGWMGWAKNGEEAGTEGFGYRLEAIQIMLVEKGDSAPGSSANSFVRR
jgi:uncharacterized protein YjdB